MSATAEKVLENRCRRALQRRGLQLVKSRQRDPHAAGYGGFAIIDPSANAIVAGGIGSHEAMDLDEVRAWLGDGR